MRRNKCPYCGERHLENKPYLSVRGFLNWIRIGDMLMLVPEACDNCPECKQKTIPKWKGSYETARKCAHCGYIQEKNDDELAKQNN